MKTKLLSLSLLFFSFWLSISAQEVSIEGNLEVDTSYADTINYLFEHLDKRKVPNHLLLDQAIEFTDIRAYNGAITDTNKVFVGNYKNIYNTLLMARTVRESSDLISLETLQGEWLRIRKTQNPKGMAKPHIVLSGLYYNYAEIENNATENGKIEIKNNQVFDAYDRQGNWINPYQVKSVFAIAPPITDLKTRSLKVSLPDELWIINQEGQVESLRMDFNDGNGYQTIGAIPVTVDYQNKGFKNWKYKLFLTNGQVLEGHTFIDITFNEIKFVPWNQN